MKENKTHELWFMDLFFLHFFFFLHCIRVILCTLRHIHVSLSSTLMCVCVCESGRRPQRFHQKILIHFNERNALLKRRITSHASLLRALCSILSKWNESPCSHSLSLSRFPHPNPCLMFCENVSRISSVVCVCVCLLSPHLSVRTQKENHSFFLLTAALRLLL